MAKGRKSGGRPFLKGNPGRPKGIKEAVSRKGVREMYTRVLEGHGAEIEAAILKRWKRGDARHTELAAAYLDGKPVQRIALEAPQPIRIVLQMPDGTIKSL